MLTVRAMSEGKGYSSWHLEHSDYYAEGERVTGQWCGRAAEMLGLRGAIDSDNNVDPGWAAATRPAKCISAPCKRYSRSIQRENSRARRARPAAAIRWAIEGRPPARRWAGRGALRSIPAETRS